MKAKRDADTSLVRAFRPSRCSFLWRCVIMRFMHTLGQARSASTGHQRRHGEASADAHARAVLRAARVLQRKVSERVLKSVENLCILQASVQKSVQNLCILQASVENVSKARAFYNIFLYTCAYYKQVSKIT